MKRALSPFTTVEPGALLIFSFILFFLFFTLAASSKYNDNNENNEQLPRVFLRSFAFAFASCFFNCSSSSASSYLEMPPLAPPPPPPLGRLFRLLLLFIIEDGQANCQLPIASTKSRRTHGVLCFQLNLFLISILFLCVSSVASTFALVCVFFPFVFSYFSFLV